MPPFLLHRGCFGGSSAALFCCSFPLFCCFSPVFFSFAGSKLSFGGSILWFGGSILWFGGSKRKEYPTNARSNAPFCLKNQHRKTMKSCFVLSVLCVRSAKKKYFCAAFLYLDNTKSGSEMIKRFILSAKTCRLLSKSGKFAG